MGTVRVQCSDVRLGKVATRHSNTKELHLTNFHPRGQCALQSQCITRREQIGKSGCSTCSEVNGSCIIDMWSPFTTVHIIYDIYKHRINDMTISVVLCYISQHVQCFLILTCLNNSYEAISSQLHNLMIRWIKPREISLLLFLIQWCLWLTPSTLRVPSILKSIL